MTDLPQVMSGVRLVAHGGPEVLVWSDTIPVPRPGPGQVLVRVLAAGVNNTDIATRLGWYASEVTTATGDGPVGQAGGWAGALTFPRIQGADLCGRVVAHGPGVAAPPIGARVICPTNQPTGASPRAYRAIGSEYDGAFAQYCLVPTDQLHDVTMSPLIDIEIGAMPCAFGTALNLLDRAGLVAGQDVLVTGASGGVGLAAVILSHALGARVTAVADASKADAVLAAGADLVIDRNATPPPDSQDVVIDIVGGPGWAARIDALRPGGRVAVAGAIAGPLVPTDLRRVYLRDITIHGCTYQPPAVFARLVTMIRQGTIRPLVSQTYPLADIARAQADFMAKRFPGKLVLIPPQVLS
jgi:NADPH:quinone reductase-like Zn-dependent oxidoreductase